MTVFRPRTGGPGGSPNLGRMAKKGRHRKGGRTTPKGTRPPGTHERHHEHGDRGYDAHDTGGRPSAAPSRGAGSAAPKTFRTGHRGG